MSGDLADASVDVDVAVAQTAHREHHTMGVERGTSDWAGLDGGEEGSVGLDGVDARAGDIEEGECVCV